MSSQSLLFVIWGSLDEAMLKPVTPACHPPFQGRNAQRMGTSILLGSNSRAEASHERTAAPHAAPAVLTG